MTSATTINTVNQSDANILDTFRNGEEERALNEFVRTHQRFVYSVAYRYLQQKENAQDASQEVFLRAIKAIRGFKGESTLQTWLYRITMNVCNSMVRKGKGRFFVPVGEGESEMNIPWQGASPLQDVVNADFNSIFQSILLTLPAKQRETFCLRYFDELSYEEISEMVNTSVGALKANYHWAVKKIAVALKETQYYEKWQIQERENER
ncbi:MAG: RNA polymerase sigma factor [Ignavibacteria bacterium]|nr:RNA polymerase sigma factor [Ignavibacteria bacterium]